MTPSVPEEFTGSKSELPADLETVSRRSGIEFSIDEFYEGSDHGYPTYYVEASIQYRAMFDLTNTTEFNIMCDEVVAATPVEHTHDHQDINPFSLQAYSLAEIFVEIFRTTPVIFQAVNSSGSRSFQLSDVGSSRWGSAPRS